MYVRNLLEIRCHNNFKPSKTCHLPDINIILKDHKILKKLQSLHEATFSVHGNWTTSLENVPATAKQILPPFFPPFILLKNSSAAARHIPSSATFLPSGSLPHFIYSQQFCFFETNSIIPIHFEIRVVVNITSFEQTSKLKIHCRYMYKAMS
jgi:hypothetical protein